MATARPARRRDCRRCRTTPNSRSKAWRAQGNPFYVEEVLSYLHDRGIDPRVDAALQSLELPASLHSLVLSRIDQLRVSQQLSLKVASIIGRVFRAADLHDYHPALGTPGAVRSDLQVLDRLGLTPLQAPDPDLTYLFKHRVTLDVGYQSLPHSTRMQLHGEFARYLEVRYADRLPAIDALLAHHYVRAEIDDKACHHLRRAGEQAAAAYANLTALTHFGMALQRLPKSDTTGRADVLLRCEALHDLLGQHDARQAVLDSLHPLATGNAVLQATLDSRRAKLAIDLGNYAAARRHAQAAVTTLESTPDADPAGQVDALLLLSRAMFFAGEAAAARPMLDRGLAVARQHGDRRGEYRTLSQIGLLHWHLGDFDAAQRWLGQALPLAESAGDARAQLDVLNNLGVVAKARAAHRAAIVHYEHAQQLARRIGDRAGVAMLANNLGSACLSTGDFVSALQQAEQASQLFTELNEPTQLALALINHGEALRELGQYATAQPLAERALALLRTGGLRRGEAIVLENLGLIASAQGRVPEARAAFEAALAIARDIDSRALVASTLLHLGTSQLDAGELDASECALGEAMALARELGIEPLQLQGHAALARLQLLRGEQPTEHLDALLPQLQSATAATLPLALHAAAVQALEAHHDPRAAALREHARAELRARSERIADATLRRSYLDIREHRAIAQST
jgi:tetratricopeptide (TPR) repeat protein